mgnify:CR=1 FL=1|nr:MAG TPA: Protein of unknown function (DUF968) [Bacteriophage sp.]
MSSIILNNEKGRCFICGRYCQTEEHHIFGAGNRKKSEKLGLMVDLCHYCHNERPNGVHFNAENNNRLKAIGQMAAMLAYNLNKEEFIKEMGRNYL